MKRDVSFAFFAAGVMGGVALGVAAGRRRQPTLRRFITDKSKEGVDEFINLADKACIALARQQEAVRKAVVAARKTYLKTAI